MINKLKYTTVFLLFLSLVISCEKDFKSLGGLIITNTKFKTNDTVFNTIVKNKQVPFVIANGLEEYLLGVYNDPKNKAYKKIEASIVSQIASQKQVSNLKVPDRYEIDGAFLVLPYQATKEKSSSKKSKYKLDSTIGDVTKGFSVKIYQNGTYLNRLNPTEPSKNNIFKSNKYDYQKIGETLNEDPNYTLKPNPNDTVYYFNRYSGLGKTIKDSIKIQGRPFLVIPLNKEKIKTLFLDKYNSSDFDTKEAFQNYFRGLIIEVVANQGSLLSFNFVKTNLIPYLQIYYTDLKKDENDKYIRTKDSYSLSGVTNSIYKMTTFNNSTSKDIVVQGTAGSIAEIKLFEGINLDALRAKKWLINDASLTFYVDQSVVQDSTTIPDRLFLYKTIVDQKTGNMISVQLKDFLTEGINTFGGKLEKTNKKPEKYTFKITDYISDLLKSKSKGNPKLLLKVFNSTDLYKNYKDTIVKNYNWNPKMVTLLNHLKSNGNKKVQLKISYSIKTD